MGGISLWQLLIIVLIVVLLFGTNKLRNLGADLGASLKGFKKAVREDEDDTLPTISAQQSTEQDADFKTTHNKDQATERNVKDSSAN